MLKDRAIQAIPTAVNEAILTFDLTSGKYVKQAGVTINSSNEITSTSGSIHLQANGGSSTYIANDGTDPLVRLQQTGIYGMGLGLGSGAPQYTFHAKNVNGTRAYFNFQALNAASIAGIRLSGYTATGTGAPSWSIIYKEATYADKFVFTRGDVHKMSLHEDADKGLLIAGTNTFLATIPQAKLELIQTTPGSNVFFFRTAETNDDPCWALAQFRAATTDATVTNIPFTTESDFSYHVRAEVLARRTGGTAGSTGDTASYTIVGTIKNIAGTASVVGSTTLVHQAEDNAALSALLVASGSTIVVRIAGDVDNNYTWHVNLFYQKVST